MTLANNFPILFELLVDDNIENYVLSDYIFYEPSNFIINDDEILNSKIK